MLTNPSPPDVALTKAKVSATVVLPSLPTFAFSPMPPSKQPARIYLQSLSLGSQPTMKQALATLVSLLLGEHDVTAESIYSFPWEALRFEHTSVLRARLADRYKHSTANKHIAALRGVLKAAWQLELMTAEQYHKAASIKHVSGTSTPTGRSLKEGELKALLLSCQADPTIKGCRDLAIIALLFATGLRRHEVTHLTVGDYDQQTHALHVRGKGKKERTVYVEATGAYLALQAWLEVRGNEPGPLFSHIRRGGHLVQPATYAPLAEGVQEHNLAAAPQGTRSQTRERGRLSAQAIYDIVATRALEAGVLDISTHDFRRNFVSDLLDNQVDLSTVQKLARHASPTTTAAYDRRPEATKKKAAGTLHVPTIRWQPPASSRESMGIVDPHQV
jgi:integrase/recombinase XerD